MEQVLRPNVGQYAVGSFVDVLSTGAENRFPLMGPVINLGSDRVKQTDAAKAAIDKINHATKGK